MLLGSVYGHFNPPIVEHRRGIVPFCLRGLHINFLEIVGRTTEWFTSAHKEEEMEIRLSTDMETKSDRERYSLVAAIVIVTSEGSWNIYVTEVYKVLSQIVINLNVRD